MLWLTSLFIASITTNVGLLKIISDDKFERPNLVALFINTLLSLVGGVFVLFVINSIYASFLFILFNVISFLLLVYMTRYRTVRALELGEKLLIIFKTVDLQISYILSEMIGQNDGTDITKPIRLALRYILSEIPSVLGLDNSHHPQLSILIPENNKFKVVAYSGIENFRVAKIEEMFQYGPNVVSLAGHAMNQRRAVVINDLTDEKNSDSIFWIRTFNNEPRTGSLLAFPIIRGLGPSDAEPIAILYITSTKRNAFANAATINILSYFALKIEILQNCLGIAEIKRRL